MYKLEPLLISDAHKIIINRKLLSQISFSPPLNVFSKVRFCRRTISSIACRNSLTISCFFDYSRILVYWFLLYSIGNTNQCYRTGIGGICEVLRKYGTCHPEKNEVAEGKGYWSFRLHRDVPMTPDLIHHCTLEG